MMKTLSAVLFCVIMGSSLSCTDEDKVAAAIKDGTELNQGDPSPIILSQNYPNPFNPSTTIEFGLAFHMRATIKVFTEDWQPVVTLYDKDSESGFYEVTFNARDLPSGEYYYTLEGAGVTIVRRMALMK